MRHFYHLVILLAVVAVSPPAARAAESLEQTIDYLFHYIAGSHAIFIRNGAEHSPQEAADHIREKYEYYKKEIKTPDDFIHLAATRSALTGQPYLVRQGGKEQRLDSWLHKALAAHRAGRN